MKDKLLEIFEELLTEWENAESIVINDRDYSLESNEYQILEDRKKDYIERFNKAIDDVQLEYNYKE